LTPRNDALPVNRAASRSEGTWLSPNAPKVLIVGLGPMGQTFAESLSMGGAALGFLDRSSEREFRALFGYTIYRLPGVVEPRHSILTPLQIFEQHDAILLEDWDYILLALPCDQLSDELLTVLGAVPEGTRIVTLQPSLEARERIERVVGDKSLIVASPSLLAYYYIAQKSAGLMGVAYQLHPEAPSLFSGDGAEELVAALNRGGLPARVSEESHARQLLNHAIALPYLSALELAGWSFKRLRGSGLLTLAKGAADEARSAYESIHGLTCSDERGLILPWLIDLALNGEAGALAFTPEEYFETHAMRLRAETQRLMRETIELAKQNEASQTLETLHFRLNASRSAQRRKMSRSEREEKRQKKRARQREREARRAARR